MKIKTLNVTLTKDDTLTIYAFTQDDLNGANAVFRLLANENQLPSDEVETGLKVGVLMNDDASIIIERVMSK